MTNGQYFYHYCHFRGSAQRGKLERTGDGGGGFGDCFYFILFYCGYDRTLEMKMPREGECIASGGSSFQPLTVRGKNVLTIVSVDSAAAETLVLQAVVALIL